MKTYKVVVQPKQHYQTKMTPDELQEHLKMCRLGASRTKSKEEKRRQLVAVITVNLDASNIKLLKEQKLN